MAELGTGPRAKEATPSAKRARRPVDRRGDAIAGDKSDAGPADAAVTTRPDRSRDYIVPFVHFHLPERAVNVGFWTALAGTAALGVVDPPLAALIGTAALVARHRRGPPDSRAREAPP